MIMVLKQTTLAKKNNVCLWQHMSLPNNSLLSSHHYVKSISYKSDTQKKLITLIILHIDCSGEFM